MYVELGLVHKALGSYMFSVTSGRATSLVRLRGCAGLLLATLQAQKCANIIVWWSEGSQIVVDSWVGIFVSSSARSVITRLVDTVTVGLMAEKGAL